MSDKYRLLLHTQCIQDFNRILSESLYGLGLRREIREPARDGVVGYAAEIVRRGCEGGGDGAVEAWVEPRPWWRMMVARGGESVGKKLV